MTLNQTFLTYTPFADAVRTSALNLFETAQAKLDTAQQEGRTVLAKQVLVSAHRATQVSQFLTGLSVKIAPAAKPKARKPAVKAAVKVAVKKAVVKAAPKAVVKAAPKAAAKRPAAKKAAE